MELLILNKAFSNLGAKSSSCSSGRAHYHSKILLCGDDISKQKHTSCTAEAIHWKRNAGDRAGSSLLFETRVCDLCMW